jgi:uncharacterized protein YndB with AHSA1/START domain
MRTESAGTVHFDCGGPFDFRIADDSMPTHTAEIIIEASIQRVFEALTKPELIKLWQYGRVVTTDWKVGSCIKFTSEWERIAETLEQWGTILDLRPNEFIKYRLFTPGHGLEDKVENYCATSYILVNEKGQTRVELIHEDNRPNGFVPTTLKPILAGLKRIAEMHCPATPQE